MRDPVIAEDGHTYEKAVIEKWLEKSPTSPMTRQQLSSAMLIPNFALKQLIDQWKDEQRRKSKGKAKVANDEAQPPPLLPSTKAGVNVADGDEEDENENWRFVDEEELQAALERSVAKPELTVARAQQQATKAKEQASAGSSSSAAAGDDGADPSEDAWGTGGWLAFAGAVAVVAGGVAWASSSSSSSSSGSSDVKRKEHADEENTCIVS